MKFFKKPEKNYSKFKYALIHALAYGGIASFMVFILLLILSATPVHLSLYTDWIILVSIVIVIFFIVFLYVFIDEIYIEDKYRDESKNDKNTKNIDKK